MATTSSSGPASDGKHSPALTESQYLAQQADKAQEAMRHTLEDLKHTLTSSADVRLWTKKYPWIATATALAAGVAAGYALTPRDKDEVREMWEKLKDTMTSAKAEATTTAGTPPPATPQASILGSILKEAIKMAGPLLASFVASAGESGNPQNESEAGSAASAAAKV